MRFFTTQYFSHVFLFLEVMTVLPFPKLSYNSFPAKCRGGLCTQAQMGRCGPTLGSCWRVTDVKGLEQVGVGRRKGLIQQESRVEHQPSALTREPGLLPQVTKPQPPCPGHFLYPSCYSSVGQHRPIRVNQQHERSPHCLLGTKVSPKDPVRRN